MGQALYQSHLSCQLRWHHQLQDIKSFTATLSLLLVRVVDVFCGPSCSTSIIRVLEILQSTSENVQCW